MGLNSGKFPQLDTPSRTLLGPGPSMVPQRVLQVMGSPLVGHLDPCFLKLMDRTQSLLRYVFETENRLTIPVSGTGSAAMEMAMANMVEPEERILVCINGYFGHRLADMASRYGGKVKTINRPWGEVFTPDEISEALKAWPSSVVAIVQAETSTGASQPLEEIVPLVHNHGGVIIVDAVTSLGGMPVGVDEIGIDVCYSASQKCLSSPPGLGPITVSPRAIEKLNQREHPVANWYLDLSLLQKYWGEERTYHHTAPITSNYALYESLRLIAEEGLEERWNRHQKNVELLWNGLESLGLKLHVSKEHRLPMLTTVCAPNGVEEGHVRSRLLQEYNIEIAGGLGELKGKVWRIGLMGHSSRKENVVYFLSALEEILNNCH